MWGLMGSASQASWKPVERDFQLGACSQRLLGFLSRDAERAWTAFNEDANPLQPQQICERRVQPCGPGISACTRTSACIPQVRAISVRKALSAMFAREQNLHGADGPVAP